MQYFMIFIKALPYILDAVKAIEVLFSGEGRGAEKKAAVMETAKILIEGGTDISTGGQKDTWIKIAPLASSIINAAASIYFPSNKPAPPDAG